MRAALATVRSAIGERRLLWLGIAAGFLAAYYGGLMAAVVVRFDNFPNYVTFYDYPGNVYRILVSTPALSDALPIIQDEWLIEIGYMNYDYGHGVSEWAMTVLPLKLLTMTAVALLTATAVVLLLPSKSGLCPASPKSAAAVTGGGAALVGLSSATLSWVVCCATPTWVVSLAMLGMSSSLALWLQPLGQTITFSGFALLLLSVFWLARRRVSRDDAAVVGRLTHAH